MQFTLPGEGGLIGNSVPYQILHSYERIPVESFDTQKSASAAIAQLIIDSINSAPKDRPFKLGLSTGKSPKVLYNMLSKACGESKVSFSNVEVFTLDEYYPLDPDMAKSRNYIIHSTLLDNIDIKPENVHTPDSTVAPEDMAE